MIDGNLRYLQDICKFTEYGKCWKCSFQNLLKGVYYQNVNVAGSKLPLLP
jgi:hypothetical protein